MRGRDGASLEHSILTKLADMEKLQEEREIISNQLELISKASKNMYQKVGIIKYDALKELNGKLSFSLCLLDNENSGFILTSMHTKDGCYTYLKEIIKGEAFVVLSLEEKRALEEAKNKKILYAE